MTPFRTRTLGRFFAAWLLAGSSVALAAPAKLSAKSVKPVALGGQVQLEVKASGAAAEKPLAWSVVGENNGSVDANGLFHAPATHKTPATISVVVKLQGNAKVAAKFAVPLAKLSVSAKADKTSVPLGGQAQVEAKVSNGAGVKFELEGEGSIDEHGTYTAPSSGKTPGKVRIKVSSLQDPSKSTSVSLSLAAISVSAKADKTSVPLGGQAQVEAKVTNGAGVKFELVGEGSVDAQGKYTAPSSGKTPGKVSIKVSSAQDPSKAATVAVAIAPLAVRIEPCKAVLVGGSAQLAAKVTGATDATSGVSWSVLGAGSIDAHGRFSAPATLKTPGTLSVKATSLADPSKSATYAVPIAAVSVEVSPKQLSVPLGGEASFAALVHGADASAQKVSWSVEGGEKNGSIDDAGRYRAPANLKTPAHVTLRATSSADPSKSSSATVSFAAVKVSVRAPAEKPELGGTAKLQAEVQAAVGAAAGITWKVESAKGGSIDSDGTFHAPARMQTPATVTVRATSDADPSKSAIVALPFAAVAVELVQAAKTVELGGAAQLTATIRGATGDAAGVTWTVEGDGSIDANGRYTPPQKLKTPATVTVRAKSEADPSKSATAKLEFPAVSVALAPQKVEVELGASVQLKPSVTHALGDAAKVSWSVVGSDAGTIDPDGTYHAPTHGKTPAKVKLRAVSDADPSKSAEAEVDWPAVAVALSPSTGRVRLGEKLALQAKVAKARNSAVEYSVEGDAGSISSDGTFTAPALLPEPPRARIVARSKADPSKSSVAVVDLAVNQAYSIAGEQRVSGGQPGSLPVGAASGQRLVVDGKRVLAAYNDGQALLVAVSEDRGATFKAPQKLLSGRFPIAGPQLALAPHGPLYVAFRAQQRGQPGDVMVCRTPDLQHAFDPCVKANGNTGVAGLGEHALALGADGTIYVAWHDGAQVTLARSANRGVSFSAQSFPAPAAHGLALAVAPDGTAFLAFTSGAALRVLAGTTSLSEVGALSVTGAELGEPALAARSAKEVALAYVDSGSVNVSVLGRGTAKIASAAGATDDLPSLALDGDGLQLAFRERTVEGQGIRLARAPQAFEGKLAFEASMPVSTFGPAMRGAPSVAVDEAGRGFVAWTDGRAGDAQGRHQDIYVARADEHPVRIEVSGASKPLLAGQIAQLTAKVTGTENPEVRWSVDDGAGRGTVDAHGLYTAPTRLQGSPHVYVRAVSVADPSRSAALLVELAPQPELASFSPASCGFGEVVTLSGHHFGARYPGFGVTFGGVRARDADYLGWDDEKISLRVPPGAHSGPIEVTNAGGTARSSKRFEFLPVAISVEPEYVLLAPGQKRDFAATVLHAGNKTVSWRLDDPGAGALSSQGLVTAEAHEEKVHRTVLRAVSAADPSKIASAQLVTGPRGGQVWSDAAPGAHGPVLAQGRIITTAKDGTARAVDRDGQLLWKTKVVSVLGAEGAPPQLRTPIVQGDRVLIVVQSSGSCAEGRACEPDSGELVALELGSGKVSWRTELGEGDFSDPVAFPDGVAVARFAGALLAFDLDAGHKLWSVALPKGLSTAPVLGPDGLLHGTGDGGVLYAVSAKGKAMPAATFPGKPTSASRPAISADGTLYVASDDGKLRAMDAHGKVRWSAPLGGHVPPRADTTPLLADGRVYVATATTLEAFGLDGARQWQQSCGACSAPILRGPDGTLYAGRYGPQAFAPDGTFLWAADAPNEGERWSPGVLTRDGLLLWTTAQGLSALIAGAPQTVLRSGNAEPAITTQRSSAR